MSPKFHEREEIVPSESVELSVNWIVLSVVGELGEYVNDAVGELFATEPAETVTLAE